MWSVYISTNKIWCKVPGSLVGQHQRLLLERGEWTFKKEFSWLKPWNVCFCAHFNNWNVPSFHLYFCPHTTLPKHGVSGRLSCIHKGQCRGGWGWARLVGIIGRTSIIRNNKQQIWDLDEDFTDIDIWKTSYQSVLRCSSAAAECVTQFSHKQQSLEDHLLCSGCQESAG